MADGRLLNGVEMEQSRKTSVMIRETKTGKEIMFVSRFLSNTLPAIIIQNACV